MKAEKLNDILRNLNASSTDIEASAIVSTDGLTIAAALTEGIDEDRVGAMSAAMLSLGNRTADELRRGQLEQIMIKGNKGYVMITNVGKEAVLIVVARPTAKLGLVFLDTRRAAEAITKEL